MGRNHFLKVSKKCPDQPRNTKGFPLPDDADESAIHDILIPHLLGLASDRAIPNVDASRFERDATRKAFDSESAAVIAFSHAIRMPCEDLSRAIMPPASSEQSQDMPPMQDKKAALKFWGFKVGRGILMNAGEGINFQFVDLAFGGLGNARVEEDKSQEDVDPDEEDPVVTKAYLVEHKRKLLNQGSGNPRQPSPLSGDRSETDTVMDETASENEVIRINDLHDEIADRMAEEDANNEPNNDDNDENDDGTGSEDQDDDEDFTAAERSFIFRSTQNRSKVRERVESDVPCNSHIRAYRGHCNVKTVKDANFFGLQDEYVVSGSDGSSSGGAGHVFIWDRKTSQLVNILEGDSDVVNVIQGTYSLLPLLPCLLIFNHLTTYATPNQATLTNPSSPSPESTIPSRSSPLTRAPKKMPEPASIFPAPTTAPMATLPSPASAAAAATAASATTTTKSAPGVRG